MAGFAAGCIQRAYRKVTRLGRAIRPESPVTDLHDLRKACKQLRYATEAFQRLYPPAVVKGAIADLRQLQDNLGELQDAAVQAELLRHLALEPSGGTSLPAATVLTMGLAAGRAEDQAARARLAFAERFARFDTQPARRRFVELTHPDAAA